MNTWPGLRSWRPVIMGRRGAVASNHPLATEAGAAILRQGGNAADAYVATASTLAVVEPHMSGLGGEGFALVQWTDGTGQTRGLPLPNAEPAVPLSGYSAVGSSPRHPVTLSPRPSAVVINATGRAPLAATPDRFSGGIPAIGPLTTITPALVDGWCEVNRRFGSLPLATLLESAIYYAREGFGATPTYIRFVRDHLNDLAADPGAAAAFLPTGGVPVLGTPIRQPALARTLELLAAGGRDAFYEGETARQLARWIRERGGLLSEEDLRRCRSEVQEPVRTTYRDLEVLEAPPNSVGTTLLQELNVAEQLDLRRLAPAGELPFHSADLVHTMVEIKKLCYVERERIADLPPDELPDVVERLLSKKRAADLAGQIDPKRATPRPVTLTPAGADTTYLCVADGAGNAISGIQSLNDAFGAAVVAGETGILLNNRMRYWHLQPGHPNYLVPGKRVRHTMNPPLALRDGKPYLVFGTPGGDAQVQINFQIFTAIVDFGFDPQQAVELPRWQSFQPGTHCNWPHDALDQLVMEDRFPETVRAELDRRGHSVQTVGALEGPCSENVIRRESEDGFWQAGSDPRRDAYAIAF